MTEICDSIVAAAAACSLSTDGEVKETIPDTISPCEKGHAVHPVERNVPKNDDDPLNKENDKNNDCSAAAPLPSCRQQQLVNEANHLPQVESSCIVETGPCNPTTVQNAERKVAEQQHCTTATLKAPIFGSEILCAALDEDEGWAQQPPAATTSNVTLDEKVVFAPEDNSEDVLKEGPPTDGSGTLYSGNQSSSSKITLNNDKRRRITKDVVPVCLSNDVSLSSNNISVGRSSTMESCNDIDMCGPSPTMKEHPPTAISEGGSQLIANCCLDSSMDVLEVNMEDVTTTSISASSNVLDVNKPLTIPGTAEVITTIREESSVCNNHIEKLPETTESAEIEASTVAAAAAAAAAAYNNTAVILIAAPDGAGLIQCAAEAAANISHEKPTSVESSKAPGTEYAVTLKPFLPNLEEDVQARSNNPQQSLNSHVTCDLLGNNDLANAFKAIEAQVVNNSRGPETGSKEEDISTLHGVAATRKDAEFAYTNTAIGECAPLPTPEMVTTDLVIPSPKSSSVLEKDRSGDDGSMTGVQLQKMLELEDEYALCTTTSVLTGLQPQKKLPATVEEHYAPCSTVPTADPKSRTKRESSFEMCVAPCATVKDLTSPPPQKLLTLEKQYAPCSTVMDGLIPQKTSFSLEKHVPCLEEEEEEEEEEAAVELLVSLQLTIPEEEGCTVQATVANSPKTEQQQLAIPQQIISAIGLSTVVAAAQEKEELSKNNDEQSENARPPPLIDGENTITKDSSSQPWKRIKFQEEVTYMEGTTTREMGGVNSLPPESSCADPLMERNPYSNDNSANNHMDEMIITMEESHAERGGMQQQQQQQHNNAVTSNILLKESPLIPHKLPPTEDASPDSDKGKGAAVAFDKQQQHEIIDPSGIYVYQAQCTIKDLRDNLAAEKRKRILLAAALSEEARCEAERTVAQMREEFEMEKSKWGGAEQGLMEYDGGRGQRESQENEVKEESENLRSKWANGNEYHNIEEIVRAEFAQRKELLVLTQAMASEMADSQQRSLNRLRDEMRNEMKNEVLHFKEEIRKEVESGLKLDQEKAVLLAETRLEGEAENLRQYASIIKELRVAHLKCKELESQCNDAENARVQLVEMKQALEKLSNQMLVLEPKYKDTVDELAAIKTLAESYCHQLKGTVDELAAAKASAEKYRTKLQMANEEVARLHENQEGYSAVMGELTGLRAQNGLMSSTLSRECEHGHSLQIKLDNALEQTRFLRQSLAKYNEKEEDLNAAASSSILVPDEQLPSLSAVVACKDRNVPGTTTNFGGSFGGGDGPPPHYAMKSSKEVKGGAVNIGGGGSEHSTAAYPTRETSQIRPPRMVKDELQEAYTVSASMPQTVGNEYERVVGSSSTRFTAAHAISTPPRQAAAYQDPYSSLGGNRVPKRETSSTMQEGLFPFSPQRVPGRPRTQLPPQQPQPHNAVARQTLMPKQQQKLGSTTTSAAASSAHQMTDRYIGQQKTLPHHHLANTTTTAVHNPY